MCLKYDGEMTRKWKCRKKLFYGYKILDSKLVSPYYNFKYKVGWNKSNRKNTTPSTDQDQDFKDSGGTYSINKGIHVYINYYEAFQQSVSNILKVKCYYKDLVGIDYLEEQAVLTKVYLGKSEYQKAINGGF